MPDELSVLALSAATLLTGRNRHPVTRDYKVPFAFTGKIDKLKVKLGPAQLTPEEQEMIYGTYLAKQ